MDTTKIKEYIAIKVKLDEEAIQQQIQLLKETYKNSQDTSMSKLDDSQLREIMSAASNDMGLRYLLGQDNAIIGIGFAQLVIEGRIDKDIKALTVTAIKRELLPVLLNRWDTDYQNIRKQELT